MPGDRSAFKNPTNSDTKGTGPSGGGGRKGVDNRSKYAEVTGQDADGAWQYRRVGPAALDWNHATQDRWNPYLATTKNPQEPVSAEGAKSKPDEDATRVYLQHRQRDADPWPYGSLNDVFLVPCDVHDGGTDADGNPVRRLMMGIDKAEFYANDSMHGALAHIGIEQRPKPLAIPVEVEMYYHRETHRWRWRSYAMPSRAPGPVPTPVPNPGTPTPGSPHAPPSVPGETQPTGPGSTTPSPTLPSGTPLDDIPGPSGRFPTSDGGAEFPTTTGPTGPVSPGAVPFGSGGGLNFTAEAQVMPSRTERGVGVQTHMGGSDPTVFTGLYGPRSSRPNRGWIGSPLYDAGVEYLPDRPKKGWVGTHTPADPGELATAAVDWTDNTPSSFTQTEYDTIHETTERKEIMDAINVLDAKATDLDSRARGSVMDCTTVTVPAGSVTVATSTTYAYTGDAPKLVGSSAAAGFNVTLENFAGAADSVRTADVRISDAAPAGGVECSIIWQYAVADATAVS